MKKIIPATFVLLVLATTVACNSIISRKETSNKNSTDMKTKEIIVDVRSPEEWEFEGHASCSVNYPLDEIREHAEELKKYDHVILVCRSGGRASAAKQILENSGVKNIENRGPWQNVSCRR